MTTSEAPTITDALGVDIDDSKLLEVRPAPEWGRPVPVVDTVSEVYFRACAAGALLIQECPACGHAQHYPRLMCTKCAADPQWKQVSGEGTVYTYTVVQRPAQPGFDPKQPYVLAMIELAEGPRLMGNVTDVPVEQVHIGMPVTAYIAQVAPEIGIPLWAPREDQ